MSDNRSDTKKKVSTSSKNSLHGVYPRVVCPGQKRVMTSSPNFPRQEESVLSYWDGDKTFEKSVRERKTGPRDSNDFIIYDGPPFANGLPHYGHLLTGYAKDVIPRYQTMRGRRVPRTWGWDTHGLPAELEAEKELGFTNKDQIDEMGIAKFNDVCRKSVMKYANEWKSYVRRQGRWVSFEKGYKTMDLPYMESVIWAFKQLYEKGLIYEGNRVLPYCPQDETPLSNHELRMDADVYHGEQTETVALGVRMRDEDAYAVFWTTTPWTVPSNLAIVVGADIDYVEVQPVSGPFKGKKLYFAKARVGDFAKELGKGYKTLRTLKGADLVGRRYWPPMPYLESDLAKKRHATPGPNAYTIFAADYVDTVEGTGIVHQAPYGEDDMNTLKAHHIHTCDVTDDATRFTDMVPEYEGLQVFKANTPVLRDLRRGTGILATMPEDHRPLLIQSKSMVHSYPHCWRCGTPLVYKPVSSWFVKVTALKKRMLEENRKVNWIPANVRDGQFGKWLSNARDWSITRNRYWGSPIPVWVSDDPHHPRIDVYGSLAELKKDFGRYPTDREGNINLHRPWIDELTRPNPNDPSGKSTMHRVPDVLDVWFDSASMPFAQFHYPFENREYFKEHFPSDFIVEYIGQTRGWFYVQMVMSTGLFNRAPFTNVLCHGIVLGSDGDKMSKHLHNYPDVNGVFNKFGSDAMRWFLMSSPILRGGNLIVTEKGIRDVVRQVLLPLWSSYYFFGLYANAANGGRGYEAHTLSAAEERKLTRSDRYILAALRECITRMSADLDAFAISDSCHEAQDFIDTLTNWYIRNNRRRFWDEDPLAFDTLYTVLEAFSRAIAPLAPMVAEQIWRGLTGGESVHLALWPELAERSGAPTALGRILPSDPKLVHVTRQVRDVVSATLSLRKSERIRVRQPLPALTVVASDADALAAYTPLLKRELDVKKVGLTDLADASSHGLTLIDELRVNARKAGPRLGRQVQYAIRGSKSGRWKLVGGLPTVQGPEGPITLQRGEYTLTHRVEEADAAREKTTASAVLPGGGFVLLDTAVDADLRAEGWARDTIRRVQDARKEAGLDISDHIALTLTIPRADALGRGAVDKFSQLIRRETLADRLTVTLSATAKSVEASVEPVRE